MSALPGLLPGALPQLDVMCQEENFSQGEADQIPTTSRCLFNHLMSAGELKNGALETA